MTYEAGKHAFFQVGAGYYHFDSLDQLTFFAHLNFVNLSTRKAREPDRSPREVGPADAADAGCVRRWLSRLVGEH